MIEIVGNIWDVPADVRCITTNGVVKKNGEAVMGAGVAKQAKLRYPDLPKVVGEVISLVGNHVAPVYRAEDAWLFTFPVKNHWKEAALYTLIQRSSMELVEAVDEINNLRSERGVSPIETVVLPRPGCGNGQLPWKGVKDIVEPILDDRFVIVEIKKEL